MNNIEYSSSAGGYCICSIYGTYSAENIKITYMYIVTKSTKYCFYVKFKSSGSGMWWYGLDRAGSGQGQVAGTCECGNEPSGSIK